MFNCKRFFLTVISVLLILSVPLSVSLNAQSTGESIEALVTIPPQKFLVAAIGGDNVTVTSMVPTDGSPHSFSLTPSKLRKVTEADIYFKVGTPLAFEQNNLSVFRQENPNMKIVNMSKEIKLRSLDEPHHHDHNDENDHHHHDENDNHGEDSYFEEQKAADPHVWLSPQNQKKMARNIFQSLVELDRDSRDYYETNLNTLLEDLSKIQESIEETLEEYKGRSFIVYHPGWGYFAEEFQLEQIAIEEGGDEPGPRKIREIADHAKSEGINKIIASAQFSPSAAEMVAREFGGSVATINPLSADPLSELIHLAEEIASSYNG